VSTRLTYLGLGAALLLGAIEARGANPPNPMDLPPSNIIPGQVDITPPAIGQTIAPEGGRPAARVLEPTGNPLWAIPLSALTATRDRPIFVPSRRPPAAAVAGPPPVQQPVAVVAPPAEPERPQLTLVGVIANETEGFGVFLDQATNSVVRLRTGQDHSGWVLRSVKGREAVLQKGRETATMVLPAPGGPMAAPIPGGQIPASIPGAPINPRTGEPEL
jgi:general secretion pathway protein N